MFTWIGLVVLLMAQEPGPTLDQQYAAAIGAGSAHALVTLIARHEDGTPVRGFISCAGWWQKYQDRQTEEEPVFYESLPFRTDSRGAVVMNPHTADGWVHCWASDRGKRGSVTVQFSDSDPLQVREIVLNEESE